MNPLLALLQTALYQIWFETTCIIQNALRVKTAIDSFVKDEETVAIMSENDISWISTFIGAICSSKKVVIISPHSPLTEVKFILQQNNVSMIFASGVSYEKLITLNESSMIKPGIIIHMSYLKTHLSYDNKGILDTLSGIFRDPIKDGLNADTVLSALFSNNELDFGDTKLIMYKRVDIGAIRKEELSWALIHTRLQYYILNIKLRERNMIWLPFYIYPILGILFPLVSKHKKTLKGKDAHVWIEPHEPVVDPYKIQQLFKNRKPELLITSKSTIQNNSLNLFKLELYFNFFFRLMYLYLPLRCIALNRLKRAIFGIFGGHIKEIITTGVIDSLICQELMEKGLPIKNTFSDIAGPYHICELKGKDKSIQVSDKLINSFTDVVITSAAESCLVVKESQIVKYLTDNSEERVLLISLNLDDIKLLRLNQKELNMYLEELIIQLNKTLPVYNRISRIVIYPEELPKDIEGNVLKNIFAEIVA